ncbi:MAG: sulfite exporter TauE/SafE family protein [Ferruginibacter sp.]|nr:sulfite exporter TauE/SafE family protein [Ferruginibacter sp.]
MEILGYVASILIGISLGLIGSGGSILAVPILVYLFNVNPQLATTYSLFIVGVTSFVGVLKHYKLGNLKLKTALYFAIPSVLSLLVVRIIILPIIPQQLFTINSFIITKDMLLMIVFAVLMMVASLSMIKKRMETNSQKIELAKLIFVGISVGFVTGFLGAGGGFLIIPTLLFMGGLSMKQAVGTSLLIVFINSFIGFIGDVYNGTIFNYQLLFTITIIALIGMFIGTALSKKINNDKLKPIFGWFVLIMGVYIIIEELL